MLVVGAQIGVHRQSQHGIGLRLGDGEAADAPRELGVGRLHVHRDGIIDRRRDPLSAQVRRQTYEQYAWPQALGALYRRNGLTLALVRACVEQGVPLLGICRGYQEINVAMGGTLHQQVQTLPGMMDHRDPDGLTPEAAYAPVHPVHIVPGTCLADWAGGTQVQVNSLHGQGVNRLAPGLTALAHAPDGLVEAFEVQGARTFACAVQWHPEWRCWDNPFYSAIFKAFGDACEARRRGRPKGSGETT